MKKGFTLVELLAVIVVLSIILVIAIPQVMNMIKSSKLKAIESSAIVLARKAEDEYYHQKLLDKNYNATSIPCENITNMDSSYGQCTIEYNNTGEATIKLKGASGGKFNNLLCTGTKDSMSCVERQSGYTDAVQYFTTLCSNTTNCEAGTNMSGLVKITHDKSVNSKYTAVEYRFRGSNPQNYVTFNGEEAGWRIVGVFDGRVKLVKVSSIGIYSWDTSSSSDSHGNGGYGINQWGKSGTYEGADLMRLLNDYYYNGVTNGTCYNNSNNASTTCTFTGLTEEAKDLIGEATWYTGGVLYNRTVTLADMYAGERGTQGKMCSSGTYCNDEVERTSSWVGKVGLIYPSDFGYASGNSSCAANISEGNTNCNSNWMGRNGWMITPVNFSAYAYYVWRTNLDNVDDGSAYHADNDGVHPSVYLVRGVNIRGIGTSEDPFTFSE